MAGERIGLIGWSQGGLHAYLAAANEPGYKSVVTWASGTGWPLSLLIPAGAREEAEANGYARVVEKEWAGHVRYIGLQWMKDIESVNFREELAKMEAPLLAIVGTEDFMTVEDIQQTVEACQNPDSRMYVIQGGDHTFRTLTRDTRVFYQAATATLMWLQEDTLNRISMNKNELTAKIALKDFDLDAFVRLAVEDKGIRDELVRQMIAHPDIMVYYHSYEVLSKASQAEPQLFYRYWSDIASLLDHPNSYHRDFALTILANLTKVDQQDLFASLADQYVAHINDAKFCTAQYCVRNCQKIITHNPERLDFFLDHLLDLDARCDFSYQTKRTAQI